VADNAAKLERGWWVTRQTQLPDGTWDYLVQFADGHTLALFLEPSRDLDLILAAAVDAHLAGDRRWTRRSDRGGA
jgi:hypothetical protein